jgi:hypothetical protein
MSRPAPFDFERWFDHILGRPLRRAARKSRQANPTRFDAEFPLHVQASAIRRAEEKRRRRARLRRLQRA